MSTNLIVDMNNFVFSLRHSKFPKTSGRKPRFVKETLFIEALNSLFFYSSFLGTSRFVFCYDSKDVWRRDIFPEYKANHTSHFDDALFEDTIEAITMLTTFFRDYTSSFVLSVPRTEADDIIGVWCRYGNAKNIILSTDKDFMQLIDEDTRLYSPVQRVFRESLDPEYDLFVKCIRGDKGDNIRSAYPRVRETLLKKAWEHDLEFLNLIEFMLPDGEKVGDKLDMNTRLIDLREQPVYIREAILGEIQNYQPSKYKEFEVFAFLREIGLKAAPDVLRGKESILRNIPVFQNA